MIVKNESQIITSAFDNIRNNINIDLFIISDTGSTDNTIEVMKEYFESRNLSYEIHLNQWINFEHNRNLALQYCIGKSDYILFFDADDRFVHQLNLPNKLTADVYGLKFRSAHDSGYFYFKNSLIRNNIGRWVGILHESLIITQKEYTKVNLDDHYYVQIGHFGDRSNDPNKYLNDAIMLENAFKNELDDSFFKARYAYYCATSYYSHGNKQKAVDWFKKRIEFRKNSFDYNEDYLAYRYLGMVYKELGDHTNAINTWITGWNTHPSKAELLYEISLLYSEREDFLLAYQIALCGEQLCINPPDTNYCYETNIYSYGLNYQISKYGLFYNFHKEALRALIRITEKKFYSVELVDHVIDSITNIIENQKSLKFSISEVEDIIQYIMHHHCTNISMRNKLVEELILLKNTL